MRVQIAHVGASRLLVTMAAIAISLRALTPIGYMPAFEGGRIAIVPCSGVIEIASINHGPESAARHSHHGGDAPAHQDGAPQHKQHRDLANCPFAVACCAALTHLQIDFPASFSSSRALFRKLIAPIAGPYANPFSARGPPLLF